MYHGMISPSESRNEGFFVLFLLGSPCASYYNFQKRNACKSLPSWLQTLISKVLLCLQASHPPNARVPARADRSCENHQRSLLFFTPCYTMLRKSKMDDMHARHARVQACAGSRDFLIRLSVVCTNFGARASSCELLVQVDARERGE